ncbi:MAG: biotin/lipoyl-binding protein, partial [Anaerolineales bacterium]|nr:biotin/lipoyl-binding protein [Anaerolineales bacterium]
MKRRAIMGMLLLGLLLIGATACGSDDKETTSQQPTESDINVTITADGNIEASSHERLTFGSGGKVDEISVKEGDRVSKGDVLARLDTGALELAEAQAQVALTEAWVALTQAQVALTQAKLAQQTAEHNLKNTRDTEDALELALFNAQIDMKSAEHYLDETRDIYTWPDIETAQKDVENAEAFLQYALERNLPEATITYAQARLDTAEAVLDAKRNVYDTEEVAIAKLQLEAAKLTEAQAQKNLTKLSEDLAIEALEVEAAKESVEHAQQNVNLARQNVDLAQKSLDQARKDLTEATIIAPFDGVVANVGVKEGEFLSPAAYTGTTIVELIDLRHM